MSARMRAVEHLDPPHPGLWSRLSARSWWPFAKRAAVVVFLALIAVLLVRQAQTIEWAEVGEALKRLPHTVLLIAVALAALSFVVYTTFDMIGRSYTRHKLATRCVMLVAFVSYAFNMNFGSLVGGVAFRYRLYTKFGLAKGAIMRVLGLSMLTNWLGYIALGGIVLCFFTPVLPARWHVQAAMLPWLGGGLLALSGAYVLACAFSKRRRWVWRSHTIGLPTARMALLQLTLSPLNWMIMASVVFTLLQARIDYALVLSVLLIAAVAGVITRVPAGLGVLEAVFVAMLSSRLPATELLAGLLAYRAVYYLLPLALAALLFMHVEWWGHSPQR
jgi:uncharacterized membrane protein YbhN (UPF0104 family)